MTKYPKLQDCEPIIFERGRILRLACCDCGLVHDMVVKDEKGRKHGVAFRRNKRATAQLRRLNYGRLQQDNPLKYKMVKVD